MTDQEALKVIDQITGDDFCEDLSLTMFSGAPEGETAKELLVTAAQKLSTVYRVAHAFVTSNSCYGSHEAWRKEAEAMAQASDKSADTTARVIPFDVSGVVSVK